MQLQLKPRNASSRHGKAQLHCNDTGRLYRASRPKFNFSLKHEAALDKMDTSAHVRVEDLKAWTDV